MPVTVRRNTKALDSLLKKLPKKDEKIFVGINQKEGATKHKDSDATLAEIASYQEYGWVQKTTRKQSGWLRFNSGIDIKPNSTLYLPPRPFLRATFNDEKEKWKAIFSKVFEHEKDVRTALGFVGMKAVEDIKQTIENNGSRTHKFPDRSDLTMALYEYQALGHKTDRTGNISSRKALVLDGKLLKSITFRFSEE